MKSYTESKLIFFHAHDYDTGKNIDRQRLSGISYTYERINAEISKYVKDGWIAVNVSYDAAAKRCAILFCR